MKIRKSLAAATVGLAIAGAAALPARAVDPTPVLVTVATAGSLSISVPTVSTGSFVDLGSVAAGSTAAALDNTVGVIEISDTRTGLLNNNWVASAVASDLLLDGNAANAANPQKMIPAASLGYVAGTVTKTVTPATGSTILTPDPVTLAVAVPVATNVALGANGAKWSPKVKATVLPTVVAGAYKGTVTHSAL